MSFKADIESDIYSVFLNDAEFADYHRVEGKAIPCVLDSDKGQAKSDGSMYDLAEADFILIAKSSDLPPRKEAGALLNLDGRELTISYWDEQSGVAVIGLYSAVTA